MRKLNASRSTLYRKIGELEELGMVKTERGDKKTIVEITQTGKMHLEIIVRYGRLED